MIRSTHHATVPTAEDADGLTRADCLARVAEAERRAGRTYDAVAYGEWLAVASRWRELARYRPA